MIKQNKNGDLWDDYVKHFRNYKIDDLNNYMSDSYSKSYTKWHPNSCVMKHSNGTVESVTPDIVENMLENPCSYVLMCVDIIYYLLWVLIFCIIYEFFIIHMYKMEALSKKAYDVTQFARRGISIIMQIVSFVCICYIASHSTNPILKFLASTPCTFDESINGSFI
jgi:hypothetical protein